MIEQFLYIGSDMITEIIGVIGLGNAGGAVAGALARKTKVVGFDPDPDTSLDFGNPAGKKKKMINLLSIQQ